MQRRSIISLIGSAALAATSPLAAQQPRPARIGVLALSGWERQIAQFKAALGTLGYVEGRNLIIELRSAQGKPEALDGLAQELVRANVDLILAILTPSVFAAKRATSTIPIVMAGAGDPVGTGLIASLSRPGGNITGIAGLGPELAGKSLELMREIKPAVRRIAVLANATDPFTKPMIEKLQSAALALRLELLPVQVRGSDEYEAVFAAWARQGVDAVYIQGSLPTPPAVALAMRHRLPPFSSTRPIVEAGGLFAYTASEVERALKTAWYVDKILKGAKPADLPAEQPTRFFLIVNGKTAKALGLVIPQTTLLREHEVIE